MHWNCLSVIGAFNVSRVSGRSALFTRKMTTVFIARRYARAVYAIVMCPRMCLSHAGRPVVSKRLNLGSRKERHSIAWRSSFLTPNIFAKLRRQTTVYAINSPCTSVQTTEHLATTMGVASAFNIDARLSLCVQRMVHWA